MGALVVKETRPGYAAPGRLERVRKAVEEGLPVEAVKELQAELKRFGVRRPSEYVDAIVSRATLQRRNRLKPAEGEQIVRVASLLATAADVWGNDEGAAEFLTSPHPMLGGAVPIDPALSEIGARQVERTLLAMDLGLPV
jgi:putative toxin-antitoxin system antitoxin component (TIGR02293 family)